MLYGHTQGFSGFKARAAAASGARESAQYRSGLVLGTAIITKERAHSGNLHDPICSPFSVFPNTVPTLRTDSHFLPGGEQRGGEGTAWPVGGEESQGGVGRPLPHLSWSSLDKKSQRALEEGSEFSTFTACAVGPCLLPRMVPRSVQFR